MNRFIASGIGAVTLLTASACVAQPYGYYEPAPAYVAPAPYYGNTFMFGFYDTPYPYYYARHRDYDWGYWHGERHHHWGGHWEGHRDRDRR